MKSERVVIWFSAGVTSAIAARIAIAKYKDKLPIIIVNTDTGSEHSDNFRFMDDISNWLDYPITVLKNPKYKDTFDVYRKDKYLVGVAGARCSLVLKKQVRQKFENLDTDIQVFGFDFSEKKRVERFKQNNPLVNLDCPLVDDKFTKNDCHSILIKLGIKRPVTYDIGFNNANCLLRGCVKGQAGYWNFYRKKYPDRFNDMAQVERELDVAINKRYEKGKRIRVFLDELPENMGRYKSEPVIQCGMFCGEF